MSSPNTAGKAPAAGRGVIAGAFALLEALGQANGDAGLTQLAENAGLPKATAHRLLAQLSDAGAVERNAGRYRIGPLISQLSSAGQARIRLRPAASRALRRLATFIRSTACVTVSHGDCVHIVDAATGGMHPPRHLAAGMTWPLYAAPGQGWTAASAPHRLAPPCPTTGCARAPRSPRDNWAAANRQDVPGLWCAAAPVQAPDGTTIAAVCAITTSARDLSRLNEAVRNTALIIGPAPFT